MTNQAQVAPIALTISDISVRQDAQGRYCLNDLHKASGGEEKYSPNRFTRTDNYQALVSELTPELAFDPSVSVRGGKAPGTYVVKELVYAYAMWISASFSLKVIRAYDALQGQPLGNSRQLPQSSPIKSFRTRILVCIDKGEESQQIVPFGSCVIDPNDPVAVATFIREYVPSTPKMLSALSSAYITKLMNCQDTAINHLKSPSNKKAQG